MREDPSSLEAARSLLIPQDDPCLCHSEGAPATEESTHIQWDFKVSCKYFAGSPAYETLDDTHSCHSEGALATDESTTIQQDFKFTAKTCRLDMKGSSD